jgi:hypothetical protein
MKKIGMQFLPSGPASPLRPDTTRSQISRDKPFAYPNSNLAEIAKKAKFRDLFAEHFQNARKSTADWKPIVEKSIER